LEEIVENHGFTREQIQAVLEFAARSAAPLVGEAKLVDARPNLARELPSAPAPLAPSQSAVSQFRRRTNPTKQSS
jgi:hypothetical protein